MSHAYTFLLYHFVFAVQGRFPMLRRSLNGEFRRYASGILRHEKGRLVTAAAEPDHAHILGFLHQSMPVADGVRLLKANSSRWLSKQKKLKKFSWQVGYGAFTVSPSQMETVKRYIDHQQEHHRRQSFREEVQELFRRHAAQVPDSWRFD